MKGKRVTLTLVVLACVAFGFALRWYAEPTRESVNVQIDSPRPSTLDSATSSRVPTEATPKEFYPYELESIEGRKDYARHIVGMPAEGVLDEWRDAMRVMDQHRISALIRGFGFVLRQDPDSGVYEQLAIRLFDVRAPMRERLAIVSLFETAATPTAVRELLEFNAFMDAQASDPTRDERLLARTVRQAIATTSQTWFDGLPNWPVAPVLSEAWARVESDGPANSLGTLSTAIGYLGTVQGVQALVDTAVMDTDSTKGAAALMAITRVRATEAVPVLAAGLKTANDDQRVADAMINGLVSVGSPDAMFALLGHLDRTGASGETLTRVEAMLIRRELSEDSLRALELWTEAHPNASFSLASMLQAVRQQGRARPSPG